MKKKGFTLAEVLITLGIIGVVAALTAPALIQNTGSAKVGPTLAKAVTTFEVANQNMFNAIDVTGIKGIASAAGKHGQTAYNSSMYIDNLSNYMKMSAFTDAANTTSGEKLYKDMLKNYNGATYTTGGSELYVHDLSSALASNNSYAMTRDGLLYVIAMRDLGALIDEKNNEQNENGEYIINSASKFQEMYNRIMALNNPSEVGTVLIDINGKKEPNRIGKDAFVFVLMQDGSLRPFGGNKWSTKSDSDNKAYNWRNGTADKCNETEITSGWTCAGSVFENNLKVIYQ